MTPPPHSNDWPQALNDYIDKFPDQSRQQQRRARMSEFGTNVAQAWVEIEKADKDNESLANVFLMLPDVATSHPYTALYGERFRRDEDGKPVLDKEGNPIIISPKNEAERYKEAINAIDLLLPLVSTNRNRQSLKLPTPCSDSEMDKRSLNFEDLMHDMDGGANQEVMIAVQELNLGQLNSNLRNLRKILDAAKPNKKRLSKYQNEDQAARATYTKLVAELNRYLVTPKYSALETLANANCPGCIITAEAIKKAWKAITDGEVKP